MNADAALANGVDAMLSTFNGEENNVANPEHPTAVLQMRNACKKMSYTVVSSWAYDGEHEETGMENWKKSRNWYRHCNSTFHGRNGSTGNQRI